MRRLLLPALACRLVAVLATAGLGGAASPKGHLVLIGGGDKPPEVMRKFVELAGGKDAPIVVIPTASSEPDAASYYEKLFREEYGCTNAVSLDIRKKADAAARRLGRPRAEGPRDLLRRRRPDPDHERPPRDARGRRDRGGLRRRRRRRRDLRRHRLPERGHDHRRRRLLPGRGRGASRPGRASASSRPTSSSTSTSSGASARTGSSPSSSRTPTSSASASTRRPRSGSAPTARSRSSAEAASWSSTRRAPAVSRQPQRHRPGPPRRPRPEAPPPPPRRNLRPPHPNRRRCPMHRGHGVHHPCQA